MMKRFKQIAILIIVITLCFETLPFSQLNYLAFGATKKQEYTDVELQRAVSLGIGSYAGNVQITHEQFFKMLDCVVKLANPQKLVAWQSKYKKARNSKYKMSRADGMVAVYLAAETLGDTYCQYTDPDAWDKLNNKMGERWEAFTVGQDLIEETRKPTVVGPKWEQKTAASYFLSFGRLSMYNDKPLFDYDVKSNSMRTNQPFLYWEALKAALRLHDSNLPTEKAKLSEADKAILKKAEDMKLAILNNQDSLISNGKTYYISNQGNDQNDGLSPERPWATLTKVNEAELIPGDTVYFQRNGLWRGHIKGKDGVNYSAYGTGAKPKIYASPENGADPDKWHLLTGTNNIWVYYKPIPDCGSVVFNNGSSWAEKNMPYWNGEKYVDYKNSLGNVMKADPKKLPNLYFFSAVDLSGEALPVYMWEKTQRTGLLYLRCDAGNPGSVYNSIEFSVVTEDLMVFKVGKNSIVDNLCIMYGGNNGIGFGENSTIQNCEVAWAGGMLHRYYEVNGQPIVICAGDGINTSNYGNTAINNYVHHCFDHGIIVGETGFLGWYDEKHGHLIAKNNIIEYCNAGLSLTIWEPYDGVHKYVDTLIQGNYVLYSGYGWSYQQHFRLSGESDDIIASSLLFQGYVANENTRVIDNVFYMAKAALVMLPINRDYMPSFRGNTYAQYPYGKLTLWLSPYENYKRFNSVADQYIKTFIGDKKPTILY